LLSLDVISINSLSLNAGNYSYYESSVLGEEVADNSYSQYNSNSYPTTDSNPVVTVEKEVPKVTTPPSEEKRVNTVKEKREPKEPKEQISRVSKDTDKEYRIRCYSENSFSRKMSIRSLP